MDTSAADRNGMAESAEKSFDISVMMTHTVNFALQQNGRPVINYIDIRNNSTASAEALEMRIKASPELCMPFKQGVESIPAGSSFRVEHPDIILNGDYLSSLTERINGVLTIELWSGEDMLYSHQEEVSVLAFDEWHGMNVYPELLATFVTPNHPLIAMLSARAADLLEEWTGDPSLDGYISQDPNRILKQIAAVYGAIQEKNIVYSVPPASFEASGQRVRMVERVIQQKMGTCLDLTLLYASVLESIGLNPMILLKSDHAFLGVWLDDLTFPETVSDDPSLISKRLAQGVAEVCVVETTLLRSGANTDFDKACEQAEKDLKDVVMIIDVKRARNSGIRPMPNRVFTEDGWKLERADVPEEQLTSAPQRVLSNINLETKEETPASKKLQWERKLLDLGLRNSLINLRHSRTLVPLMVGSLDDLEDALADGKDFSILPRPADWKMKEEPDFSNLHELKELEPVLKSEFKNHRLRSAMTEAELTRTVKEVYRSSKQSIEENGANSLYLAFGLLRWYETAKSTKDRYAPVLLIPVEMVRKSAAEGYVIRLRDDDPQMNITILEKLKQDYGINVTGLDPLPQDEHGIDTRMVFTILRKAIMSQKNWDVLESAYLGIFSFSQFVMWNDLKNRADDLAKNKVVKSLMDGKLSWQADEMSIGEKVDEDNVFLPLPADASQLYAIEAATQGESFVLHGPPGTGKSQTITTLIANALAHEKTVLFVAEKMAALEVVQKRLEKIGLGAFCLELHSNKSKKRSVLEQLRRASEVTKEKSAEEYAERAEQISKLRKELDAYSAALHKKRSCGMDAYEIINEYEKYKDAPDIKPFTAEQAGKMTSIMLADNITLIQRLVAAGKTIGDPSVHPMKELGCCEYSQQLKVTIPQMIEEYKKVIADTDEAFAGFTESFEIPVEGYASMVRMINICTEAINWSDIPAHWTKEENLAKLVDGIKDLCQRQLKLRDKKNELLKSWKPDFLTLNGSELLEEYRQASGKWFLAKSMGVNSLFKRISAYSLKPLQKDNIEEYLNILVEYNKDEKDIGHLYDRYGYTLGVYDKGEGTDWGSIYELAEKALLSAEALKDISGSDSFRMKFCGNIMYSSIMERLISSWNNYLEKRKEIYDALGIDEASRRCTPDEDRDYFDALLGNMDDLRDWVMWNDSCRQAREQGLGNVVDSLKDGLKYDKAEDAYRKAISKTLAMLAIDEEPVLNKFSGNVFNEKIQQFRDLDAKLTKLTQEEIFCRLASRVPNFAKEAANSSELGIIQKAIRSGGRGVSIRRLFDQIPNMLPRLCPCMLMSPISAAQYLDPEREPFDIVVFDEASQLQTCKAVGALARGKNAVIVGDPKQMPPTSFFSSNQIDEDNLDIEDLESILDDCLALNMPQTHLLWHYRSRHESLIAFSNHRFYENKLFTFPSVNDRERKVRLVHVDGVFERGKNRYNMAEAQAIIEELKRRSHDKKLSKLSVGVVTFNINQQNLIDDLLIEACKTDPVLEKWAYGAKEPLFIKNLENVQGDERDVILFSVSFGPDETGKVSMNFGPLNRDGGWRRLNVAVSRARCEMVIFTIMTPDMIDLSRTSSEGVAALRSFLEYAGGKEFGEDAGSVRIRKSGSSSIADKICTVLSENGYSAEKLVGHSEYRIDIGVIDPDDPEKYILGILLDGSGYGSSKTTRDREIAQISVLEGLGWHIMRIWTMDWWDNSNKEMNRILAELERLKNLPEEPEEEEETVEEITEEETVASDDEKISSAAAVPVSDNIIQYKPADLEVGDLSPDQLLLAENEEELQAKVTRTIYLEAPVSEEVIVKRVLQSYGITTRSGSKQNNRIRELIAGGSYTKTEQDGKLFFWRYGQVPGSYYEFRSNSGDNKREPKDIAVEEAANALYYVLYDQVSLPEGDLIREAEKVFGLGRTAAAAELFKAAVGYAENTGNISIGEGNVVLLTDQGMKTAEKINK